MLLLRVFRIALIALVLSSCGNPAFAADINHDIQHLLTFTDWSFYKENSKCNEPLRVCVKPALKHRKKGFSFMLVHSASPALSDEAATAQISDRTQKIIAFLKGRGWSALANTQSPGSIPKMIGEYRKQSVVVQLLWGTGRCTMFEMPCTAFDDLDLQIISVPSTKSK
jgi:hypothetical protein